VQPTILIGIRTTLLEQPTLGLPLLRFLQNMVLLIGSILLIQQELNTSAYLMQQQRPRQLGVDAPFTEVLH
jgi:hypothetical protein